METKPELQEELTYASDGVLRRCHDGQPSGSVDAKHADGVDERTPEQHE